MEPEIKLLPPEQERREQFWEHDLVKDRNGGLAGSFHNLKLILDCDELLQPIRFNRLAGSIEVTGKLPWREINLGGKRWRDADEAHLMDYVETWFGIFPQNFYTPALLGATDNRAFHPVVDYLKALPDWDGVKRVETLLVDYLGAEDTPYVRAVTAKTLCAAIWRAWSPGKKFDNILVLSGPQGIGKSTLISRLGGEWYSDSLSLSDMNDKTAAEKLMGVWLMEIGEMAGMKKAELEKVKAFLSRQEDRFRPAYARNVVTRPRGCVFFGTTNNTSGYLRDVTGNRRFWTVECSGKSAKKPWDLSPEELGQIWKEALLRIPEESLLLSPEQEAAAQECQREALEEDDFQGLVESYLSIPLPEDWYMANFGERVCYYQTPEYTKLGPGLYPRETVCNLENWCECLGRPREQLTKKDSARIAMIMARVKGWEKQGDYQYHPVYGKQRIYQRISEQS
jgi:predicted P-loop ATPase